MDAPAPDEGRHDFVDTAGFENLTWYAVVVGGQPPAVWRRQRIAEGKPANHWHYVRHVVEAAGYQTFIPTMEEERRVRRSKPHPVKRVTVPVLKGYIFIGMQEDAEDWLHLTELTVVRIVVADDGRPKRIRWEALQELQLRADNGDFRETEDKGPQFRKGESVRIRSGLLRGKRAKIKSVLGRRARISLELFGNSKPVSIAVDNLTPVDS